MKKKCAAQYLQDEEQLSFSGFRFLKWMMIKYWLKSEACGICTWEQRVFTGSINAAYPLIGGHEVAGRIEAIGKDVAR
ncbi:MAG: alcohol dehydrogenase catalytic domain-containing protein [[Clostridium] innocuum]